MPPSATILSYLLIGLFILQVYFFLGIFYILIFFFIKLSILFKYLLHIFSSTKIFFFTPSTNIVVKNPFTFFSFSIKAVSTAPSDKSDLNRRHTGFNQAQLQISSSQKNGTLLLAMIRNNIFVGAFKIRCPV